MKNKHIVLMVVILVVLAGLYLAQRAQEQRVRARQDAAGGFERLLPVDFAPDDVRKFVFYAGTNEANRITVEQVGGVWRMPDKFNVLVKTAKVEELLHRVSSLQGELRSDSPDVLGEYALEPDGSLHLILTDRRDDSEHHLLIGKRGQAFQTGFVRRDGSDAVYLVGHDLRRDFNVWGDGLSDPDPKAWLDLQMVRVDAADVRRLSLATPWKRMAVEKREVDVDPPATAEPDAGDEEGQADAEEPADILPEDAEPQAATEWEWFVGEPDLGHPLSKQGVDNWLRAIAGLTASDVVDPTLVAEYGFDDPPFTLEIGLADGVVVAFEVGNEVPDAGGGDRYVRVRGEESVFTMAGWSLKNAIRKARDILDIDPVTVDREKIQALTLRYAGGKGSLRFARDGDAWTLAEPALGLEPVKSTVDAAVGQMASIRYEDIVTVPGFDGGVDPGEGSATIDLDDGASRTLVFGAPAPIASPDRFAAWEDEDGLFVVGGAVYTQIMREAGRFLNLDLVNVDTLRVTQLTLADGDREIVIAPSEDERGFWRFRMGGETFDAKTSAVEDILSALTGLRALAVILDPEANPKFEDRPRRATLVAASAEEGAEPQTYALIFGSEVEENVSQAYLAMEGREGLFAVPATLVDRVMRSPEDLREIAPVREEEAPEEEKEEETAAVETPETVADEQEPSSAEAETAEAEPAKTPSEEPAPETASPEGAPPEGAEQDAPQTGDAPVSLSPDAAVEAAPDAADAGEEVVGEAVQSAP